MGGKNANEYNPVRRGPNQNRSLGIFHTKSLLGILRTYWGVTLLQVVQRMLEVSLEDFLIWFNLYFKRIFKTLWTPNDQSRYLIHPSFQHKTCQNSMIKQRCSLLCVGHACCIGSTLCGIWRFVPTWWLDVGRCHPAPAAFFFNHWSNMLSHAGPTDIGSSIFAYQKPNFNAIIITASHLQNIKIYSSPDAFLASFFGDAILHHLSKDWALCPATMPIRIRDEVVEELKARDNMGKDQYNL